MKSNVSVDVLVSWWDFVNHQNIQNILIRQKSATWIVSHLKRILISDPACNDLDSNEKKYLEKFLNL